MTTTTESPPAAARYLDLVYAAALRQTGRADLADEVTQAVFLVLARKSARGHAPQEKHMAGWLLNVTRYAVKEARRAAARRAKHERAAATSRPEPTASPATSADILAAIDDALLRLPALDREAVTRRYLCGEQVRTIAHALDLPENTANQRILRALKKLQSLLARRGITAPAAAITTALFSTAILKAPAATAAAVTTTATPAATALAHHTLGKLALAKAKLAAALLTTAAAAAAVVAFLPAATAPASLPAGPTLVVVIADRSTGKPLPNVHVDATSLAAPFASATTDAAGRATLPAADIANVFTLTAATPGYVHTSREWVRHFPDEQLPAELALTLERGITVGGKVVDDAGNPVAAALVTLTASKSYGDDQFAAWGCRTTTDDHGLWTYDGIPADATKVECDAFSPRFATDDFMGGNTPDIASLKNRSALLTVHAGVPLTGIVLGPDHQPATHATIGVGTERAATNATPEIPVDAAGRFTVVLPKSHSTHLLVRAAGAAPVVVAVSDTNPEPLHIQLPPPITLAGRILDPHGTPIPHALVLMRQWNTTTLPPIEVTTDTAGHFAWPDAPNEPLTISVTAAGYLQRQLLLKPGTTDVTLTPMPLIRGQVVDADSGKPLTDYTLIHGTGGSGEIQFNDGDADWLRRNGRKFPDGRFEFSELYEAGAVAVRAYAGDYYPGDSSKIHLDTQQHDFVLRLRKGQRLAGQLLDPRGKPAANIPLRVFTDWYEVYNGELPVSEGWRNIAPYQFTTTDADGRFSLPPQAGPFALLAQTADGFLGASSKHITFPATLRLTPWAKVLGHVSIDGAPVPEKTPLTGNLLSEAPWGPDFRLYNHFTAQTDAHGDFAFTHLFPGEYTFARGPAKGSLGGDSVRITLAAGDTQSLALTHSVLMASGVLVPPPEVAGATWRADVEVHAALGPFPTITLPPTIKTLSEDARQAWFSEWKQSSEGRRATDMFAQAIDRESSLSVEADGAFQTLLPPGSHKLSAIFLSRNAAGGIDYDHPISSAEYTLNVARPPGSVGDTQVTLGKIPPQIAGADRRGQLAPDFWLTTLDGQTHTLSDFRGKVVLLYFWGAWCGACKQDMPNVQAIQKAFGDDPRFVLVSLSVNDTPEAARAEIEQQHLTGTLQAILGKSSNAAPPLLYSVRGYPSHFLIAPDGKLLEAGYQVWSNTKRHVESILEEMTTAPASPAP